MMSATTRRVIVVTLLLLSVLPIVHAQKDAPVAGHAANIFDLLRKDYSVIDPELRKDEIAKDRRTVISIFKVYLQDSLKKRLTSLELADKGKDLQREMNNIDLLKRKIADNNAQLAIAKDASPILVTLRVLSDQLATAKSNQYQLKFEIDDIELNSIKSQYKDNGFLQNAVDACIDKYNDLQSDSLDKFSSSNAASSIQKGIPFIGGDLSFETVIDGLSRFIAKRIKEELTTYVITRVQEWLNDPSPDNPLTELKILLPRTTDYLAGFTADKITNFINEIKQYIEDDLNHILANAPNLRKAPRIGALIASYPDIDFAFEALELIPSLSKVKNPVDYFTFLENSRNIIRWKNNVNQTKYNIANTIHLTGLLSRSLLIIDNNESRFAGVDFLTTYASESRFYQLYVGFLRQQNIKYYNIDFKGARSLEMILHKIVNANIDFSELDFFKTLLIDASGNAEYIFNTSTELRKANKAGKKPGADTAYSFIESIIGFSEKLTVIADTLIEKFSNDPGGCQLKEKTKPYFSVARGVNEIVFDVRKEKYATALIKAIEVGAVAFQRDDFGQLTSMISRLHNVNEKIGSKDWLKLAKLTANPGTDPNVKIDKDIKSAAEAVINELGKIEWFNTLHTSNTALGASINAVRQLRSDFDGATIDVTKLNMIGTLFADNNFQKLVISYYGNMALESGLQAIRNEMVQLYIVKPNGDSTRVFSDAEADNMVTWMNEYATSIVSSHFLGNNPSATLETQYKKLQAMLADYLLRLPQRFGLKVHPNVLQLIHFVNDMAVSKDAEDVEKAIEAFALPAGSYSIKRKAKNNFAINSYPGILVGYESADKGAFSLGFTAPVGLSYSWTGKNGGKGSWGIFVPIIDIGAVTRLRLDEKSSTQTLPEFSFRNILSPGVYLSRGWKNSPFSVNIGLQYGPELREITSTGDVKTHDSYRVGVGFVLDIPLFNLHTTPRKD